MVYVCVYVDVYVVWYVCVMDKEQDERDIAEGYRIVEEIKVGVCVVWMCMWCGMCVCVVWMWMCMWCGMCVCDG